MASVLASEEAVMRHMYDTNLIGLDAAAKKLIDRLYIARATGNSARIKEMIHKIVEYQKWNLGAFGLES